MSFETRLRQGIAHTVDAMPGETTDIESILRKGRERRSKRRAALMVSVLVATTAMASVQLFGFTPGSEDINVTVAGREMAYSEILSDDPVLVRGVPGQRPRFDTSDLGPEIPFAAGKLPPRIPDQLLEGGVFAGAVEGIPVFVYGGLIGSEEVFCATTGGDSICTDAAAPGGGSGFTAELGPSGEVVYGVLVVDLPAEVSVVAYYDATGAPLGWQTPVAYVSYMPLRDPESFESEITVELFDADGRSINVLGGGGPGG